MLFSMAVTDGFYCISLLSHNTASRCLDGFLKFLDAFISFLKLYKICLHSSRYGDEPLSIKVKTLDNRCGN